MFQFQKKKKNIYIYIYIHFIGILIFCNNNIITELNDYSFHSQLDLFLHAKYILNITALYPPQHSHSILFLCKDGAFQRYTCHQFKPYKTNHNQIYSPILSLNCFNNLINNWVNNNKIMQMLNKIFFLSHSTQGLFTTQFNNIWV